MSDALTIALVTLALALLGGDLAGIAVLIRMVWKHEGRIRKLEVESVIGEQESIQNFGDHAEIKTKLGTLEVKVDRSSEAVNSLVLFLRLREEDEPKK